MGLQCHLRFKAESYNPLPSGELRNTFFMAEIGDFLLKSLGVSSDTVLSIKYF